MKLAVRIIAICEVIRIVQNAIQLSMMIGEKQMRKNLNNEFINSLTAKDFLKQYEEANRRIKLIEKELTEERLMIDSIRSVSGSDGMPHSSGINKPVEDKAVRLADKAMKRANAILQAVEIRQRVFDVVIQVEGTTGDVLYERYIMLRTWQQVADRLHISWNTTHKHHRIGLEKVSEIIGVNN